MKNILDAWLIKVLMEFIIKQPEMGLKPEVVKRSCDILYDFFGKSYFELEFSNPIGENPIGENWLHYILKRKITVGIVKQVVELAFILEYFKVNNPELLTLVEGNKNQKNFRSFRNYFFELYIYTILDLNGIKSHKKKFEGLNELEGTCFLNGEECLFECKKLYSSVSPLYSIANTMFNEFTHIQKKHSLPLISITEIHNSRDKNIPMKFRKALLSYIHQFSEDNSKISPIKENIDKNVSFEFEPYTVARFNELEQKYSNSDAVIIEFALNPEVNLFGQTRTVTRTQLDIKDITGQIIKKIREKRHKRSNSIYKKRIYFFEAEYYGGPDSCFIPQDGIPDKVSNEIEKYLSRKSTDDVVIIIFKNLIDSSPLRNIYIYAKDSLENYKSLIKNMDFEIVK